MCPNAVLSGAIYLFKVIRARGAPKTVGPGGVPLVPGDQGTVFRRPRYPGTLPRVQNSRGRGPDVPPRG